MIHKLINSLISEEIQLSPILGIDRGLFIPNIESHLFSMNLIHRIRNDFLLNNGVIENIIH